jgi:pimeloyl-ACP methyl ester carboxylesterase
MKNKQFFYVFLSMLFMHCLVIGQARNEIACFDNFQYNSTGNSKVNAYLLALVSHNMYPRNLLKVPGKSSQATALLRNAEDFEIEFRTRLGHWFHTKRKTAAPTAVAKPARNVSIGISAGISEPTNRALISAVKNPAPIFEFLSASDERGYDPEAMIISTKNYVILAWRGTDRVANDIPLLGDAIFDYGEWIKTDFQFNGQDAPDGVPGKVHRGFDESVRYDGMIGKIADRLKALGVANKKLWITGHSLGGAHAQISALYLEKLHNINAHSVYTYASPGVGDAQFNRAIEGVLPGSRLQRFVFMSDPIPRIPTGLNTLTQRYKTRAGQLNHYTKESGNRNYWYNKRYTSEYPSPFVCFHNPHWYARAAYYELTEHNATMRGKVPNAPSVPTEGCKPWDMSFAEGNGNFVQGFLGIDQDLEPGTYNIINARTNKYLNVSANDAGRQGKPLRMDSFEDENRFKWKFEAVGSGLYGGYTIENRGKVIDAARNGVGQQDSEVIIYERNGNVFARTNQEWEMERNEDGSFYIKNIQNRRFSLKSLPNGRVVLDDATGEYSKWYLVKVRN